MSDLLAELLKFFSEFTWKKLFSIIALLALGFFIVSLYELYTSTFRFSRLQKAAELLSKLDEIDSYRTNASPDLLKARNILVAQAVEAINTKPITLEFVPSTLKFSMDGAWKFMAGAAFWSVLALFQLPKIKANRQAFMGTLMVAAVTGFVGMFLPNVWWPWFHIFIFPWIFLFSLMVVLLPFAFVVGRRAAKKDAQVKAKLGL